jgi:hypothetical protein
LIPVTAQSVTGSIIVNADIASGHSARFTFQDVERADDGNVALWRRVAGDWQLEFVRRLVGLRELQFGGLAAGDYRLVGDVNYRGFETEFAVTNTEDMRGYIVPRPKFD